MRSSIFTLAIIICLVVSFIGAGGYVKGKMDLRREEATPAEVLEQGYDSVAAKKKIEKSIRTSTILFIVGFLGLLTGIYQLNKPAKRTGIPQRPIDKH